MYSIPHSRYYKTFSAYPKKAYNAKEKEPINSMGSFLNTVLLLNRYYTFPTHLAPKNMPFRPKSTLAALGDMEDCAFTTLK
jgi:hypothetical protein